MSEVDIFNFNFSLTPRNKPNKIEFMQCAEKWCMCIKLSPVKEDLVIQLVEVTEFVELKFK